MLCEGATDNRCNHLARVHVTCDKYWLLDLVAMSSGRRLTIRRGGRQSRRSNRYVTGQTESLKLIKQLYTYPTVLTVANVPSIIPNNRASVRRDISVRVPVTRRLIRRRLIVTRTFPFVDLPAQTINAHHVFQLCLPSTNRSANTITTGGDGAIRKTR